MRMIIYYSVLLLLPFMTFQTADARGYERHRAPAPSNYLRSPKVDDGRYFHPRSQFKRFKCRIPGYRHVSSHQDRRNRGRTVRYRFAHWTDTRSAYHPCWKRVAPKRHYR